MEIKNKRVLLTGSDGFLGSFVSKELLKQEALVIKLTSSDDLTSEKCVKNFSDTKLIMLYT